MSLRLVSFRSAEVNGQISAIATYELSYELSPAAPKREGKGTTLKLPIGLELKGGHWLATIETTDCMDEDPVEALRKLASWLERASVALENGLRDPGLRGPLLPLGEIGA